jgi:two-component system sensor histidine kinase and response regulator WspE
MGSDYSQIDPTMLELFQAEMVTHIPVLNEGLLALEMREAGGREIEGMMRAAHSIKGAARIVGIEPAVRVAHAMEDCFNAAKENRITLTSDAVDVLLVGVDALQRICSPLSAAPVTEEALGELLDQLTRVKSGNAAKTTPVSDATAASPPAAELVPTTVEPEEPNVALPSSFNPESCETLRRELLNALARRSGRIRLDFARVGELNAAALALLASFAQEAVRMQPMPAIESRRIGPVVRTVLGVAGLDEVYGAGR